MATAPNPSPTHQQHSPRAAAVEASAAAISSPSRHRDRVGASSWNQIVRGVVVDFESTMTSGSGPEQIMTGPSDRSSPRAAASMPSPPPEDGGAREAEGGENGSGSGNNASKKPVWNKPNGGSEIAPVMGAVIWPALSESTRVSPKSSSDSLKTLSDLSVSAPQTIQGSGIASPSQHKQGTNSNATTISTPNHAPYNRQRSGKHNSGKASNSVSANGGFSQLPSPQGSGGDVAPNSGKNGGNSGSDSSSRDNTNRDGGQRGGFSSQSHSGSDHQHQRNSFRRGNGGPHPRGDGPHHHGYGGRRNDQDRANQAWNPNRGFGGRDNHMQPHRVPSRSFMQGPPPPTAPFVPPPMSVRHFGPPVVYPEMPSPVFYVPGPHPESVRAVPLIPPMPPMFFAFPDPQLHSKIVNQIEYYFSNENLIKDTFLRQNMDDQGWVPIKLIASFKKVLELTDNVQLILDAVRSSTAVEVEGDKVRRQNDWKRWIMGASVQYSASAASSPRPTSGEDKLSANLQGVTLDDKMPKTYPSPSSSGEWSNVKN